jgi:hypothetical protein
LKSLARPNDRADILRRLRQVRPDSARRWGRMSAHQMVCHLGDGFRMCLGHKAATYRTGAIPRVLLKWIVLYAPLRWPAGIATSPEIDQVLPGCTKPTDFGADVERVESLAQMAAAQGPAFDWPPHPVFGRLSGGAWMRWAWLHMDHHLRQFGA